MDLCLAQREFDLATGVLEDEVAGASSVPSAGKQAAKARASQGPGGKPRADMTRLELALVKKGKKARRKKSQEQKRTQQA